MIVPIFGVVERTFRLKTKDGQFAWIFDENGEVYQNQMFPTQEAAQDWMDQRITGTFIVRMVFAQGIWWCNTHKREATHTNEYGEHLCDPKLSGILMPCRTVFLSREEENLGNRVE
jgi:hypothetical protein